MKIIQSGALAEYYSENTQNRAMSLSPSLTCFSTSIKIATLFKMKDNVANFIVPKFLHLPAAFRLYYVILLFIYLITFLVHLRLKLTHSHM